MNCWCGDSLTGSLCAGCSKHFVDCTCKDPESEEQRLTDHEVEVLTTFAELGTVPLAAEQLGIAEQTLKNTLLVIRRKLKARSTIQALWKVIGEEAA